MRVDLCIRAEQPGDEAAIAVVLEAAFGSDRVVRLVRGLRGSPALLSELALVAEVEGRVVGYVMISAAELRDGGASRRVANLSPLAVAPDLQGRGIGSALVRAVTERADRAGEPMVVVEGNPGYYGRLGFEPAQSHGLHITLPSWAPAEAAQVLRLSAYRPSHRGHVVYPPAFDDLAEH